MKIISGGQTGVDRAALDAAIGAQLDYGGSVPEGRMAEDGPIDVKYVKMTEIPRGTYRDRTKKNVDDADATLIFTKGRPTDGTAYTIMYCRKSHKPFLVIDLVDMGIAYPVQRVEEWLESCVPGCSMLQAQENQNHRESMFRSLKSCRWFFTGLLKFWTKH